MRQLLPTPAVSPQKVTPIPSDRDLLPVGSVKEADVPPPAPYPESPAGCFSCGDLTHETEQCPVMDESFPFLPLGWRADRIDNEFMLLPGPRGPPYQQAGNVD